MAIPCFNGDRAEEARDDTLAGALVTIAAPERACLFGDVQDGEMRLNDSGHAVQQEVGRPTEALRRVASSTIRAACATIFTASCHSLAQQVTRIARDHRGFETFLGPNDQQDSEWRGVAVCSAPIMTSGPRRADLIGFVDTSRTIPAIGPTTRNGRTDTPTPPCRGGFQTRPMRFEPALPSGFPAPAQWAFKPPLPGQSLLLQLFRRFLDHLGHHGGCVFGFSVSLMPATAGRSSAR